MVDRPAPGFLSTGANFAAWTVEDEVRGLSDSQALKGNRHVALPLPTMARTVARATGDARQADADERRLDGRVCEDGTVA